MAQIDQFPTLKGSVLFRLRKEIITCILKPGEIIRDNDLAARFGVSTSPIREALAQLAVEGLVDVLPNKLKRVAPLDQKTASDFYFVHKLLILAAFTLGAPRVRAADLDAMTIAFNKMQSAYDDGNSAVFSAMYREFLDPVIKASDNHELRNRVIVSAYWLERVIFILGQPFNDYRLKVGRDILDSLAENDFSRAISLYRAMVDDFESYLSRVVTFEAASPILDTLSEARELSLPA